jgi:hypothetical protein
MNFSLHLLYRRAGISGKLGFFPGHERRSEMNLPGEIGGPENAPYEFFILRVSGAGWTGGDE